MHELLAFDPELHRYTVGGKAVPSVTSILQFAGVSQNFSCISPEVLETARIRGIAIHELTTLIDMGETVESPYFEYLQAWMKFKDDTGFEILEMELPVYSAKYGYAGTIDRVGTVNGKLSIIDIKTSSSIDLPSVGPQTAAYEIAYQEWAGYKKSMPRYVVQLKPDGTYKLVQLKNKQDANIFLYANEIMRWRKKK